MRRRLISVIGDSKLESDSENYALAERLGRTLIDHNYRIVSGGMLGIMEAVSKGARSSVNYKEGDIVGIIPGYDPEEGNGYLDIAIGTGLDTYRNVIVANSDAVIAIGGGAGTLAEMATAWILRRMVLGYRVSGWSSKLADTRIDDKKRVPFEEDRVFGVSNETEVIELLEQHLDEYPRSFKKLNEWMDKL